MVNVVQTYKVAAHCTHCDGMWLEYSVQKDWWVHQAGTKRCALQGAQYAAGTLIGAKAARLITNTKETTVASEKFYRVKQDTFLWKAGAILTDQGKGQYVPVEDIWNIVQESGEYISAKIIEHADNGPFFERVYPDTVKGKLFRTKDQLVTMYEEAFKS